MRLIVKGIIFLSSLLFIIPISQAGIHVEPYGSVGGSYSGGVAKNSSFFMNYDLGGRLGYNFSDFGFGLGLDLFWTHYGSGEGATSSTVFIPPSKEKGPDKSPEIYTREVDVDYQPFSIGVFGRVDLPFLFDAYSTVFYTFGEKKLIGYQGYGVKVGASYLSDFFVQLNLELKWANYICTEAECDDSFNIFSLLVSLSVPLPEDIFDFGSGSSSDMENSDSLDSSDGLDNSDSLESESSSEEI